VSCTEGANGAANPMPIAVCDTWVVMQTSSLYAMCEYVRMVKEPINACSIIIVAARTRAILRERL
jgi:hypothetical protein